MKLISLRTQAIGLVLGIFLGCTAFLSVALAVPDLQIYIPGATYNETTETWVIESLDYDLWVVGANDDIFDVKAAFAVPEDEDGSIQVTWDEGTAEVPSYIDGDSTIVSKSPGTIDEMSEGPGGGDRVEQGYFFEDYGTPVMGDGKAVPPHGVFPTSFYEYYIGDFGTSQTVNNYYPGELDATAAGEIKIFHIVVTDYTWADIVAYDHVVRTNGKIHSKFSPFSHDGGSGGGTPSGQIPEPATMFLVGTGLLAIGIGGRRNRSQCR